MWLRIRWRGLMNFLHLHHLPFTTFSAISKCAFLKWRPREKVVLKNNKPHTPLTCGTNLSKCVSVRRSVQRNGWKNGRDWLTTSIIYWRFISPVSSTLCQSVHPSMPKRNGQGREFERRRFIWLSSIFSAKGKNDPNGESCFELKQSFDSILKVSEYEITSSDFLRGNISEKFEWYEKICNNKFTVCREMVVSEFGHMTEFRWSAHFAGHNLKCAQISRKMDFLQQYNVNSGNWRFGYGGSCEVMRITPEFELEKFAQKIQFKIVWELNIYLRIAGICIQGFPVN